jgi:hypothetical protein
MFELEPANYIFNPVEFNVDEILGEHIKEPFPNKSFFWVLCGVPGSGKTSLFVNTLISKGANRVYRKVFDKILLVMPKSSNKSFKKSPFDDLPDDQKFETFDQNVVDQIMLLRKGFDEKEIKESPDDNNGHLINSDNNISDIPIKKKKRNQNILLILDDITAYLKDDPRLLIELSTNRRHLKLSIVLLIQFLYSVPKPVRFQVTDITVFKPANEMDAETIEKEFINLKKGQFDDLKRFVWKNQHDFLFIHKGNETFYKNLNRITFKESSNIDINIDNAENIKQNSKRKKKQKVD